MSIWTRMAGCVLECCSPCAPRSGLPPTAHDEEIGKGRGHGRVCPRQVGQPRRRIARTRSTRLVCYVISSCGFVFSQGGQDVVCRKHPTAGQRLDLVGNGRDAKQSDFIQNRAVIAMVFWHRPSAIVDAQVFQMKQLRFGADFVQQIERFLNARDVDMWSHSTVPIVARRVSSSPHRSGRIMTSMA